MRVGRTRARRGAVTAIVRASGSAGDGMAWERTQEGSSCLEWVDLSELARGALSALDPLPPRLTLDVELALDLPEAIADGPLVAECVSRLLRSAIHVVGEDWGCVSVGTGNLALASHWIAAPVPRRGQADPHRVCLEVHSTGPAVGCGASGFAADPLAAPGFGPLALSKVRGQLRPFGGEIGVVPWATAGACAWLTVPYLGSGLG